MTDAVSGVADAGAAAIPVAPAPSPVVEIPCSCPGTPHDIDTVTLAAEVPLQLGMAAAYVLQTATEESVTIGALSSLYLRFAIVGWSLVDDKGNPEPVTPDNALRRLPFSAGGYEVAERANDLYTSALMRPLLAARQKSSQPGQTGASMRRTNVSGRKRPVPFTPFSPSGTAGQAFVVPEP